MNKLQACKKDIFAYFGLIFSFLFFAGYFSHYSNFILDIGREAIIPQYMNDGYLLYKDLFNLFGPLGYQINALIFQILLPKFETMHTIGMVNSFIVITLLYAISRYFLSEIFSFLICFIILFNSIFFPTSCNFIFPYSYSLVYSYIFILIALLSFMYAIKHINKGFRNFLIYLTFLACGASLASKYEYIVFTFAIVIFYFIIFKPKFKNILISLVCLGTVPLISYAVCLIQGVSLNDIVQSFKMINIYVKSKYLTYFHSHITGTYFSLSYFSLENILKFFLSNFMIALLGVTYFITSLKSNKKIVQELVFILLSVLLLFTIYIRSLFSYYTYVTALLIMYLVYRKFKNKEKLTPILVFSILALCTSVKTLFFINLEVYGTYTMPLLLICILVFIVNEIVSKLQNKDLAVKTLLRILGLLCLMCYLYASTEFTSRYLPIKFKDKNFGYVGAENAFSMIGLLEYIDKTVKKDETFMFFPNGVMFNFALDRKVPLPKYITLSPPYVDAFGQDKIIDDFETAKIDYLFIINWKSNEYNSDLFGENENEQKIKQYINENYVYMGNKYGCKVYKLQNKQFKKSKR